MEYLIIVFLCGLLIVSVFISSKMINDLKHELQAAEVDHLHAKAMADLSSKLMLSTVKAAHSNELTNMSRINVPAMERELRDLTLDVEEYTGLAQNYKTMYEELVERLKLRDELIANQAQTIKDKIVETNNIRTVFGQEIDELNKEIFKLTKR